jgi:hypothetical protein
MTNRHHIPVVVTTDDETGHDEVVDYVERVVANLEETDFIFRTFVEDSSLDESEARRMMQMLDRVDEDSLAGAIDALDEVTEDETDE